MSTLIKLSRELVVRLREMPGVHPSHYEELAALLDDGDAFATPDEIERARVEHAEGSDNSIEIDDEALASRADCGFWVQAWVWLENGSDEDEDEDDEGDEPAPAVTNPNV